MFHIAELTDQVIDHLHADAATLRNCALVARSWLPASQFHIFFSVNIKHDTTCRLLCAILARSPHIAGYIRNIYIYFEVANPSFTSLLDLRIPHPRRLSIVNCPNTVKLGLLQHLIELPTLTDIRFFSGTSVSRAQLDYLTRIRTTKLAHLLLYSASDTPAPQDRDLDWVSTNEPLSVSALNVSGDATLTTSTLVDPYGPIDLRNVEALTFDTKDIVCLGRLLAVCGAELVVLEILVYSRTYRASTPHPNSDQLRSHARLARPHRQQHHPLPHRPPPLRHNRHHPSRRPRPPLPARPDQRHPPYPPPRRRRVHVPVRVAVLSDRGESRCMACYRRSARGPRVTRERRGGAGCGCECGQLLPHTRGEASVDDPPAETARGDPAAVTAGV